jgi:hypothetical protein
MKLLDVGGNSLYPTLGIFGMSGIGKTTLSATAGKLLIADSNEGTMSIDHVPEFARIKRVRINDMPDLTEMYDNLTGTGEKNWRKLKFEATSFDHFDDMQQIILGKLAERAQDNREEPDLVEQREWGIMANKLRRYLRLMKKLPMTKILIMGEKFMEQEDWMYPSLQGQMREQLPYYCDHVIYLRMNKKGVRYLHLDPKPGEFYAKTRAWWLTPEERKIRFDLDNRTLLADLIAKIRRGPDQPRRKKRKSK